MHMNYTKYLNSVTRTIHHQPTLIVLTKAKYAKSITLSVEYRYCY